MTYVYQDEVSSPEEKFGEFSFPWKDKRVLELGCNVGKLGLFVLGKGAKEYKGLELDKEMVRIGKERYNLDLVATDVSEWEDWDWDVTVAMALFHHFDEQKLTELLKKLKSKHLIFEVPVGKNDVGLYRTRTRDWYEKTIREFYGDVVMVVKSGATNDPYNERTIFYCKKNREL